jgi:5-methylcytosine-specific restriction enzyme subunit McrC
MNLFEFSPPQPLPQQINLKCFKNFLDEVWEKRNSIFIDEEVSFREEEQEDLPKASKQQFLRFDGREISARNYIGFIYYEGTQINIYPKIFKNRPEHDFKLYLDHVLFYLSYCRRIKFPFTDVNLDHRQYDNFLEVFIALFAGYTEQVLHSHPYLNYEEVTEETSLLRGRIDLPGYIKNNLSTGNWQNFYCNYEPFIYDNRFNQIVKYSSRLLAGISQNEKNKVKLDSIIFLLDEVEDRVCSYEECQKVNFNKLFDDLEPVLEMCKMFLSGQSISNSEEASRNLCFLLPMEYVYEDFIHGFIKSHFPDVKIISQSTDYFAQTENSSSPNVFQIKIDNYIPGKLILDAKYKIRDQSKDPKAGIASSDMYQMFAYAMRKNCEEVLLLYPCKMNQSSIMNKFYIPIDSFRTTEIKAVDIDITLESQRDWELILVDKIWKQLRGFI